MQRVERDLSPRGHILVRAVEYSFKCEAAHE